MDLNPSHSTLGSQRKLAKRFADETLEEAQSRTSPKLTTLYFYVAKSFANAVTIASWSRDSKNADPPQFAAVYTYLEEYIKRSENLLKKTPGILSIWPKNPGISFSWRSGLSALDVTFQFSRMILSTVECTKAMAIGTHSRKYFDELSLSDPRIQAWRDQTIQELKTKTLPPLSDWPMWKIHRDSSSLTHKMDAEFIEATQEEKATSSLKERKVICLPKKGKAISSLKEDETEIKDSLHQNTFKAEFIEATQEEKATSSLKEGKVICLPKKGKAISSLKEDETEIKDSPHQNTFKKEGDHWKITFHGKSLPTIKDIKGMHYIAFLLGKSDRHIPSLELSSVVQKTKPAKFEKAITENAIENISMDSSKQQDLVDKTSIKNCKERLDEIEEEISEAKKNNDEAKMEKLRIEQEQIQNYLRTSSKPSGQLTEFSDDAEKARKSISLAITRAIEHIEQYDTTLHKHLSQSIQSGKSFSYTPEYKIIWDL